MLRAVAFLALGCAGCGRESASAPPPVSTLEFFVSTEKVAELLDAGDGLHVIAFGLSARRFEIHPEETPDAAAVLAFARAAMASGRAVHVTIRNRPGTPKAKRPGASGPLPLIVRLADTPDPRAPHREERGFRSRKRSRSRWAWAQARPGVRATPIP